jgi:hypothetical protein
METLLAGTYRHSKGRDYQVYGPGINIITKEELVVYRPLYEVEEPEVFQCRPLSMFLEVVEVNSQIIPRFRLIKPAEVFEKVHGRGIHTETGTELTIVRPCMKTLEIIHCWPVV